MSKLPSSRAIRRHLLRAIGWALREYSKTRPKVVASYIRKHDQQLSPVSKREGMKVLLKVLPKQAQV
ncbi:MAG: DNA alkylation repair protein [Gammaproteobacteria bacterium]|nr:DNA alkylation repair protein [Gammaproteobacteria bacterium]